MKRIPLAFLSLCIAGYASASDVALSPVTGEIVVPTGAVKSVAFAAGELNAILVRAFGAPLPVVRTPTAGRLSVVLGDCAEARAAGIDVAALAHDAFTVKVTPTRVFIAGRDDPALDLKDRLANADRHGCTAGDGERATLFGVYAFLERHFGVRFYFPGDLGTIVPKASVVRLPIGCETKGPIFTVRSIYYNGDGAVPGETDRRRAAGWKALSGLRLRLQTQSVPCCHGQRGFSFPERFHKTHPEYFALVRRDGRLVRDVAEQIKSDFDVQMCHTSGLWDEMYADCKAYLSGRPAALRGIRPYRGHNADGWNRNCVGKFIDVMPQDGMPQCLCANCQRTYDKSSRNFATDLIWGNTAKLANRLKAAGFDDFVLTQMAYPPYRDVPKFVLPPNIWVMVAEMGPWGVVRKGKTDGEIDEVRRWAEKLGHKVWMWTYPSKFGAKATPGAPDMAPRAWASYFKRTVPYSYGAFCESECEKTIFHYLNYYLFSRVAWEEEVDVEAVLDEHFRLMFGAAATEMARFYDDLERKWTREVLFRWFDGKEGDEFCVSSDVRLWRQVYTPAVRAEWTRLFEQAEAKVAGDSDSLDRVRFIRHEFLDYLKSVGEAFDRAAEPERARARFRALSPAANLIPPQTEPRHLVVTNFAQWAQVRHSLKGKVKPGTRYRLSALIRLKDAKPEGPHPNGCCFFACHAGGWQWFPGQQAAFCGTLDWTHVSYAFKTPDVLKTDVEDAVSFQFGRGTGEAWIDCFSIEEVNDR